MGPRVGVDVLKKRKKSFLFLQNGGCGLLNNTFFLSWNHSDLNIVYKKFVLKLLQMD